jgi:FAD-NAD(P)-binding
VNELTVRAAASPAPSNSGGGFGGGRRGPLRHELAVAIVGAGIHGCAVAVRLLSAAPELRAALRLFDPAAACLAEWTERSWGQGMEWMRSPGVHHLDVAPMSLLEFARAQSRERELAVPYARPSLQLFMDHCRAVLRSLRLEELVVPAAIGHVEPSANGYALVCADGREIETRALVLAPGLRGHERLPEWPRALAASGGDRVSHVGRLDLRQQRVAGERILVIGGGLSAATLTAAAVRRGAGVTLVSRHPLASKLFDADPGWIGPKYLRLFQREEDPAARLRMVRRARGGGSVTPDLLATLERHATAGLVTLRIEDEVIAARWRPCANGIGVRFRRQPDRECVFDRVWCATGFEPRIERLSWLGDLRSVKQVEGRPVTGPTLELRPRCFVSGWLAELTVGPAGRNIAGARYAAGLIAAMLAPRRVASAPQLAGAT